MKSSDKRAANLCPLPLSEPWLWFLFEYCTGSTDLFRSLDLRVLAISFFQCTYLRLTVVQINAAEEYESDAAA
jgi:hypothetical protein